MEQFPLQLKGRICNVHEWPQGGEKKTLQEAQTLHYIGPIHHRNEVIPLSCVCYFILAVFPSGRLFGGSLHETTYQGSGFLIGIVHSLKLPAAHHFEQRAQRQSSSLQLLVSNLLNYGRVTSFLRMHPSCWECRFFMHWFSYPRRRLGFSHPVQSWRSCYTLLKENKGAELTNNFLQDTIHPSFLEVLNQCRQDRMLIIP